MSVRLFFVDESYDDNKFCLSAIGIRHCDWHDVLIVFDNTEPCSNKTLVYFFEKKFMRTSLLLGAEIFLNRLLASISDHGYLTNYYLRLHNFLR